MKRRHLKLDRGCIRMNIGDKLFALIPAQVNHLRKCKGSEEDPTWFAFTVWCSFLRSSDPFFIRTRACFRQPSGRIYHGRSRRCGVNSAGSRGPQTRCTQQGENHPPPPDWFSPQIFFCYKMIFWNSPQDFSHESQKYIPVSERPNLNFRKANLFSSF